MLKILTVCTGNICRSPLAAQLLAARFSESDVSVLSAGTRARSGIPMTPETVALASTRGVRAEVASRHRSQLLTPSVLHDVDLAIAMSREHRREIVEAQPSLTRSAFTARELARLLKPISDAELLPAMAAAGPDTQERLKAGLSIVSSRKGLAEPISDPHDDDIVDPYGRSERTYDLAAKQLDPTIPLIEHLIRLALARA